MPPHNTPIVTSANYQVALTVTRKMVVYVINANIWSRSIVFTQALSRPHHWSLTCCFALIKITYW